MVLHLGAVFDGLLDVFSERMGAVCRGSSRFTTGEHDPGAPAVTAPWTTRTFRTSDAGAGGGGSRSGTVLAKGGSYPLWDSSRGTAYGPNACAQIGEARERSLNILDFA